MSFTTGKLAVLTNTHTRTVVKVLGSLAPDTEPLDVLVKLPDEPDCESFWVARRYVEGVSAVDLLGRLSDGA